MANSSSSYGNIFKTTFLFGFVQIFNIIVKVILNKFTAIFLGAEGLGIIGIYNNVIRMIVTGAGLGINQSAVRDISEANSVSNTERFSRTISIVNKVIIFSALLGVIITILFAPMLSRLTFDNSNYTLCFMLLSLVVGFNILNEGQLAILKGMRKLSSLAKASMLGAAIGLFIAVPFYYFYGNDGIIPSLIITAFSSLFFSNLYVKKIEYNRIKLKFSEIVNEAKPMIKMGIALMYVTFIGTIFETIVASYISRIGSLEDVGFYNAGISIISGYFGIIITAMTTDYYPRISAIHNDNEQLEIEMNRQSETGLIMVYPLVVLFVFLSPFFIEVLYSKSFLSTNNYTDYAMIGTLFIIVSNCMGMILLAKQASHIFVWSVLGQRLFLIFIYLLSYKYLGLTGLGFSYIVTGVLNFVLMLIILNHFYKIGISRRVASLLSVVVISTIITILIRKLDLILLKYSLGIIVLIFSIIFTYLYMNKIMNININIFSIIFKKKK